jgi:hypothetical protein
MELITILNRCHRFRGFVYQQAHFSADKPMKKTAGSLRQHSRGRPPEPESTHDFF